MFINKEEEKETICFTYEVKMVVQVFAEDLDKASEKLEKEGGYVSSRKVSLLNKNTVYVSDPDTAKK
jgi:predicted enzyme related to lactoylglutathione lyase